MTEPTEINPGHAEAAAAFAECDALWDCPIFDETFVDLALLAVIDAMHGVDDFLYLCGEDA